MKVQTTLNNNSPWHGRGVCLEILIRLFSVFYGTAEPGEDRGPLVRWNLRAEVSGIRGSAEA